MSKYRYSLITKIVIIAITILICSFFSLMNYRRGILGSDTQTFTAGYYWTLPTLVADYSFSVYKTQNQYRAELQNARDSVSPVFIRNTTAEDLNIENLQHISDYLLNKEVANLTTYATNDKIVQFLNQSDNIRAKEIAKINSQIIPFLKKIYSSGYSDQVLDRFRLSDIFTIRLLPNTEYLVEKPAIYDKQKYSIILQKYCTDIFNEITAPLMVEILYKIVQPNLIYSEDLTNRAIKLAEQSVPKTVGIIHKGETIVERGQRLEENKMQVIQSYNDSNVMKEYSQFSFLKILGNIGHTAMQYFILIIFLVTIRPRIWKDAWQILLLSLPLIAVSFMGWLTFQIQAVNPDAPLEYLVLIPTFSIFVAIVFDSRTAFYATVSMALIIAGVRGNDYFIGVTMLFTGSIAAYSVRDIKDRKQIFFSIIFIFIGFILSIFVTGLERGYSGAIMMPQILLGLINAITAPVITFFLLIAFDKHSKTIVTTLKLKEYLEREHPLIAELKEKAKGTFEHSREVSNLTKLAAEAIDAKSSLAAVGALFHDIGKLEAPERFTENKEQYRDTILPQLTPQESAELIMSHVTNGVAKAEAAGIPQTIIDFIPQHHGTFLVKHFYNVACNDAQETGAIVDENDFRYPGPTPQSKETSILMICDMAEALSKSVSNWEQFEKAFEVNLEERLKDGQFADSQLTLQELKKISTVIKNEIRGKIHTRVQYAVAKNKDDDNTAKNENKN